MAAVGEVQADDGLYTEYVRRFQRCLFEEGDEEDEDDQLSAGGVYGAKIRAMIDNEQHRLVISLNDVGVWEGGREGGGGCELAGGSNV